jgi:magnesium chelatase family protein
MLVAAMNPCPCGYLTDPKKDCRCSPIQVQRYRSKISGPLLDRIDIHIEVPAVRYEEFKSKAPGESSESIRRRVEAARDVQRARFRGTRVHTNAGMAHRHLKKYCETDPESEALLKTAFEELHISARAHDRILKVARTIADLEGIPRIRSEHVAEAVTYRSFDRNYMD